MHSLPPLQPPVIDAASPTPEARQNLATARQVLAGLLSLCLGLFLADAALSLVDDSLRLWFDLQLLTVIRGLLASLVLLLLLAVYGLIGLTPMIPKRMFLPVVLFNPVAALLAIPLAIYCYGWHEQVTWGISLVQVIFALGMYRWIQGGFKVHWPLVPVSRLGSRGFSGVNLAGFLIVNLFILLPATVAYLVACAALAVDHFSEGFLALRPSGLSVQVRKYVRDDGKSVHLVPMAHVGEAEFYRKLSQSFPTNAVVLMEGVTDENNLLTNKITYQRMASSLGLAEQHEEFKPVRVEIVMADVDIKEFTADTIGLLNLAMLLHSKGLTLETVLPLLQFSPPPHLEEQLWDDLLRKRNRHLLESLRSQLADSETLIVPWGVAHMPGIAEGIQAAGFRLAETQEYTVIRFRLPGRSGKRASWK
jgi:hypothetical protein